MDSFYYTVLSDSSHAYFPDNTLSNFRNYCSPSMSLDDDVHEVALVKCSFIYSEPFVKQGHNLCKIIETKYKRSTEYIPPEMNMSPEMIPWLNRSYKKKSSTKNNGIPSLLPSININNPLPNDHTSTPPSNVIKHSSTNINALPVSETDMHSNPSITKGKIKSEEHIPNILPGNITSINKTIPDITVINNTSTIQTSVIEDTVIEQSPIKMTPELLTYNEPIEVLDICATSNCYSIQDIIEQIQKQITDSVFEYNEVLKFTTSKRIKFDEKIAAILGFSEFKIDQNEDKLDYIAQFKPYMKHGQTEMFIYSDLVRPQMMGDHSAPLLATAVYEGDDGRRNTITFRNPQYYNLARSNIESIQVYIRSESGENLPFTFGNFSAQLHFRRKQF